MEFFTTIKPIVTPLHGLLGAIGVGATIATDVLFFEFLKDCRITKLESSYAKLLSKIFWAALIGIILTGILITLSDPARYFANSKFLTKIVAVIVIITNGLVLNYVITPELTKLNFCDDQNTRLNNLKRLAFACGAISFSSWPLAFILGSISKIPVSPTVGILSYLGLLAIAALGSQAIYYMKVNRAK